MFVGEHLYYLLITYPHTSFLLPLICGHCEAMLDHNAVHDCGQSTGCRRSPSPLWPCPGRLCDGGGRNCGRKNVCYTLEIFIPKVSMTITSLGY